MKLAYIGYQVQEKYNTNTSRDEDQELFDFLADKGLDLQREVWNDKTVNWNVYGGIIIKSPWDYHEKIEEFSTWILHLEQNNIPIFNSAQTLKWNSDKHYLQDIKNKGLSIIPTLYLEKYSEINLAVFDYLKSDNIVVKPCVSAGSKNTILVSKSDFGLHSSEINTWLGEEAYMVQPFIEEIKQGEWSFLFFGGKYSHSLLKTAKDQDFRVQHYLGGSIHYTEASEDLILQAQKYIDQLASNELYARVDGVVLNGVFHLMELEMIEPYLFLDGNEYKMENYYQALSAKIKNESL